MHVVNAMFSAGLGGIEQSFLDYSTSIEQLGYKSSVIILPNAEIYNKIKNNHKNIHTHFCKNNNQWDLVAKIKLQSILKKNKPNIVIAHGNRAIRLLQKPCKNICPLVGVAHNYNIKKINKCSAIFTITEDLKSKIINDMGFDKNKIYHIPNMVELNDITTKNDYHKIPVIGTMGRFIEKKGFSVFIKALHMLHQNNISFRAIIGGKGENEEQLRALTLQLGMEHKIDFIDWVDDKKAFFEAIDIFCLPSLHEPFGIVLLEAFSYAKPVVTTATEGPLEIAIDGEDALLVEPNSAEAIFIALKKLLNDKNLAFTIGEHALQKVITNYDKEVVATKIEKALTEIVQK